MSDIPYPVNNICFECTTKMRLIGQSKPCTICFMKIECKTKECHNLVSGDSQYCETCGLIKVLQKEVRELRQVCKGYQEDEDKRIAEENKIQNI